MSVRNLQHLFAPQSIAVIGATDRPLSVGAAVMHNLLAGAFKGDIYPVNPHHDSVAGLPVWPDVAALPVAPSLALICTPAASVPGLVRQLGERGTRAAIILSSGLNAPFGQHARSLRQAALDAAHPYIMRLLGPDSIGLLVPRLGLNASLAAADALAGQLAFVSQSGALFSGVLDWARSRGIGFSNCISLGASADVDVGDVLDYLASDANTGAILLYMHQVRYARKFMSAARAAARGKPVLVLKADRASAAATGAASHSSVLASSDAVVEAAIRRAGMLRVFTTEELFAAVETLTHARPTDGARLAIMTNGHGPGLLASDALASGGGALAPLSARTVRQLDELLPGAWSQTNPVDILGTAPLEHYRHVLDLLLKDEQNDAVLLIHAPCAQVASAELARALAPLAAATSRNLLACWLGGDSVTEARRIFANAGIPSFITPEDAVGGFLQIVRYRQNQNLLMQVPPASCGARAADRAAVQAMVRAALAERRYLLSEPDTKSILAAYGIPVVPTRSATSIDEAIEAATDIGFPVALKIISPDITHKSDVGGVALDLDTPLAVRGAALRMQHRLSAVQPGARVTGFSVQQMAHRPDALELLVGVATDPVFGPVILFGHGGIAVEVTADHAVGLPPLNAVLARDLIGRTRVARLLAGYRHRPPLDIDAIVAVLLQISQLVADIPELVELDINPLLVDSAGAIVLDARLRLALADQSGSSLDRLAIRPYPPELEETITFDGAPLLLRPIRPEDGAAHQAFFAALSADDVRYRMFVRVRELQLSQLARFTQIDFDREMAFIATRIGAGGQPETLGVGRVVADPDNVQAEFAVTVRSDLKGKGIGKLLMTKLIAYARSRGTREIVGEALPQNARLLRLARAFNFEITRSHEEGTMHLKLSL